MERQPLLHQVPLSRQRKLRALEKLAGHADIVLIQETHCSLEEFVMACPRLAELFHCEASGGAAATGGILTLIAKRLNLTTAPSSDAVVPLRVL